MNPHSPWRVLLCACFCLLIHHTDARGGENVDPIDDGAQYAYGENVGWLNAELDTDGDGTADQGISVADFELTGWIWGENIGWISLSCKSSSSCDAVEYGVQNDGDGVLSGFAWGENIGWINFAPFTAGVTIDPATGDFSGRAWSENVGWITFASTGPYPYKIKTSWTCDPLPAPPASSPTLALEELAAGTTLSWTQLPGATGYDVVRGTLSVLLIGSGDFSVATDSCVAENHTITTVTSDESPAPGDGNWYLVRGANCGGSGTYDPGGPSLPVPRDPAVDASGRNCD